MQFRELIYPPGATRRDWVLDASLAITLTVGQLASSVALGQPYHPQTNWELIVCLAMTASLVFRRHAPLLTLGLAQRVALARSLAPSPHALLLDEPLSALDPGLRRRLADDLALILRETHTTAVYVTHDPEEAERVADRVVTLSPPPAG